MKHGNIFVRRLLSLTLLAACAATLSGCGFFDDSNSIGDIFGEARTLPAGDDVNFDNRHTPVLNPSNSQRAAAMAQNNAASGM